MKAVAIRLPEKPPRVVKLGPRSFSSRWAERPKESLEMGLRIASAAEQLEAGAEATEHADRLLPERPHTDPRWAATYEVCWVHYLLERVLTSPNDVNAPLWAAQAGQLLLGDAEGSAGPAVCSQWFSDSGLARLLDEYEALVLQSSEVWPEITPAQLAKLGARLVDGSFLADLDAAAKDGHAEAAAVASQIRRLLGYVLHLRTNGLERAPLPG